MTETSHSGLTHVNESGSASMVDVGDKPLSRRAAIAEGRIQLAPETLELIRRNQVKKGDVLSVARIAAIQAAKKTHELIPLCHLIPLSGIEIDFVLDEEGVSITAKAKTIAQTGVEMEALTAVAVAGLTIYDMCKAVDKSMIIEGVRLVSKTKEECVP